MKGTRMMIRKRSGYLGLAIAALLALGQTASADIAATGGNMVEFNG